ncbi:MAG: DUF1501 domain-containing protein [Ottowia sp.]|uniref:DUF1501 domain-containing protein n=1 Tax=Ottowia sp. TaxID=1898956 RepID=UPI0039E2469A
MTSLDASSRRAFLRRLGHLGIAGTAAPWALNLAAIGEAAAFSADGYKALVCVFLYGGNDNGNTLIPYDDAGYAEYARVRDALALSRASLGATALAGSGLPAGRQYALAPQLAPLKPLFDNGRLALQLNVGPLQQPTTLAEYQARSVPLPPKLFSHNDQQSVWQSSAAEGSVRGWGGRLGDLALSSNGGQSLFTCMSVTGNAVFLSGDQALAYQIGTGGAVAIQGVASSSGMYGAAACREALRTLITQGRDHLLENELNRITSRSLDSHAALAGALAGSAGQFDAALPDAVGDRARTLNQQLKMVARLIAARGQLGLKRQVFLVSLGGFDTHDNLLARHPVLLTDLGAALAGFQQAIDTLGVGAQVTTFTASDFGRTMTSNGGGSDHGWGSHHLVLGGAVRGGAYYGQAPEALLGGPEDVGQGRLLPGTAVDQYAATLARWFGVSEGEMALVAPNIGNFGERSLGFLG